MLQSKSRQTLTQKSNKRSNSRKFWLWLEWKLATPEFIGGMYSFLAIFFFMAATNTLSGWLYVISGISFALLLVGAVMPKRLLAELKVIRSPIDPVSVGDDLWVDVTIQNRGKTDKRLLEVRDVLPPLLSNIERQEVVVEMIEPLQSYQWSYEVKTNQRGVFVFTATEIATSSPLGLFRSRRACPDLQKAIVYPMVLPLDRCPLIDRIGNEVSPRQHSEDHNYHNATEGLTKTLRPYRWGDPTRLIHWRSSAKFGELRVRELEVTIGGQEVAIALDNSAGWHPEDFEEAVVAAASLYFYAQRSNLSVCLWTASTGMVKSDRSVLETLAAVQIADTSVNESHILKDIPDLPVVWLTYTPQNIAYLPFGSRWVLWTDAPSKVTSSNPRSLGITIESSRNHEQDRDYRQLRSQLQENCHV